MKVGIFTDPHINKRVQVIQADWDNAVLKSFEYMTDVFKKEGVDAVFCAGDFFDKSLIEARSLNMIMRVLSSLNSLEVPCYFLLGNHEMESETENILEFLDIYKNLKAVLNPEIIRVGTEEFFFLPYGANPKHYKEEMNGKVVISHHDVYGSSLAAGRSRAKFGIQPQEFSSAKLVLNGHIHSKSIVANVRNIGSFLCGAQGEIGLGDHPKFYIWDTNSTPANLVSYENIHSLDYITCCHTNVDSALYEYRGNKVVLRYEYEDPADIPYVESLLETYPNVISHNLRRLMTTTSVSSSVTPVKQVLIDVPTILQRYVEEDGKALSEDKQDLIDLGKQLLDKGRK